MDNCEFIGCLSFFLKQPFFVSMLIDNTGPRRWLAIEFDSGTIDEQAALQ